MTPDEAERRIQHGYRSGQEVLKAMRRRRLRMFAAAMVELGKATGSYLSRRGER